MDPRPHRCISPGGCWCAHVPGTQAVGLVSPHPGVPSPLAPATERFYQHTSALLGSEDNYLVCEEETFSLLMFNTAELRILDYLGSAFHLDLISFAFTFSGMNITFISISSFSHYFFFCTFFYSSFLFLFTSPSPTSSLSYRAAFITAFQFSGLGLLVSFVCV